MATNDSPQINSPLLRRPIELGEQVSINFPDGKGVTARFAGVDIEAGGARFSIHCNQEGTLESLECTCPPNGIEALTLANADLIRERDSLREDLAQARALLDAAYDRAEKAQAAAENWEGMYRNLAEMQPEPPAAPLGGEESRPEFVGGDNTPPGEVMDVPILGQLKPEQIVINLYITPKDH